MVAVVQRDKAKRLMDTSGGGLQGNEQFRHSAHIARLRLKCDLYEVALAQGLADLKQATIYRHNLQPGPGLLAIAQFDQGRYGWQFDTSSTVKGMWLGIVCHAPKLWHCGLRPARLPKPSVRIQRPLVIPVQIFTQFLPDSSRVRWYASGSALTRSVATKECSPVDWQATSPAIP
jgi:hypothetical protein